MNDQEAFEKWYYTAHQDFKAQHYSHLALQLARAAWQESARIMAKQIVELKKTVSIRSWDAALNDAEEKLAQTYKELGAKQARIDELMLEYCPDEMTPEQLDNWAVHQRQVDERIVKAIDEAINAGR